MRSTARRRLRTRRAVGGYAAVAVASVTATEADDDVAGVSLSETELQVPEAGHGELQPVVLDTEPAAAVTVTPRRPATATSACPGR